MCAWQRALDSIHYCDICWSTPLSFQADEPGQAFIIHSILLSALSLLSFIPPIVKNIDGKRGKLYTYELAASY